MRANTYHLTIIFSTLAWWQSASATAQREPGIALQPGIHYQSVTQVTVSVSVLLEKSIHDYGETVLSKGYLFGVELGTGGGRIRAGWGTEGGMGGGSYGLGLLRTWNRPGEVAPNQTFVGPDVRLRWVVLALGAGYYWRVSRGPGADGHVLNLSVGVEW